MTFACVEHAGLSAELFRFSTTTNHWTKLNDQPLDKTNLPPSARHGHSMTSVGDDLFVFGGRIATGETNAACSACHTGISACTLYVFIDSSRGA